MKKGMNLKLLSVLCVVALVFLALSVSAFSKERVEELINADDGGEITLGNVTIAFGPDVLTKDTKIFVIDFGDGTYQFGPEIKVNGTFTLYFADAPKGKSVVLTFKEGEWIELKCKNGYVKTDHFSRYRGAW